MVYTRELLGREALALVREKGWGALSARALASRLGSSIGPIYSAFGSMEEIQKDVLRRIDSVFGDFVARGASGKDFLDLGIGFVLFARDEPRLYEALVGSGGVGRIREFKGELEARALSSGFMRSLPEARSRAIFERMWLFSVGLAEALRGGFAEDPSDEGIATLVRGQGAIVIYGEAAGFGDEGNPALGEAWTALREKIKEN